MAAAVDAVACNRDPRVRANVTWSPDSKAFVVTRMDQRKVKQLFLVNNTANPRPELMAYNYAMPGERTSVRKSCTCTRRATRSSRR